MYLLVMRKDVQDKEIQLGSEEVIEAGCKRIKIRPQMGDLKWVKGSYPTPYGNIVITHKKINDVVETTVSAPDEIIVEVVSE